MSYAVRWQGPDNGLITAWEKGRMLREEDPDLAAKAEKGELPILGWKGGVDRILKDKKKIKDDGSLWYLAQWQGLRNEDLNIDLDLEIYMTCPRFKRIVLFSKKEGWPP
jgi:hypothetical protein